MFFCFYIYIYIHTYFRYSIVQLKGRTPLAKRNKNKNKKYKSLFRPQNMCTQKYNQKKKNTIILSSCTKNTQKPALNQQQFHICSINFTTNDTRPNFILPPSFLYRKKTPKKVPFFYFT